MSAPPPSHFLLQTSDLQLRQVSRAVLTGAPEWWRGQFVNTSGLQLKPLRTHLDLHVYGIDVPAPVLDAMLELIQVPELVEDYWAHIPTTLKETMTLRAWRGFMRAYGFATDVDLDAEQQPIKRRRVMTPFDEKLEALATALHEHIFANHPKGAKFLDGCEKQVRCHFVTCYSQPLSVPGADSYSIPVDTRWQESGRMDVAHFLGRYLTASHRETVADILKHLSPAGTQVQMETALEYHEKISKKQITKKAFDDWPLTRSVTLTNDAYHVFCIRFWY